jgi:hypothetical protein
MEPIFFSIIFFFFFFNNHIWDLIYKKSMGERGIQVRFICEIEKYIALHNILLEWSLHVKLEKYLR